MYTEKHKSIIWGMTPMMLGVGLVYHVISYVTPYWMEYPDGHLGLWSCSMAQTEQNCTDVLESIEPWYRATQVLETAALACVTMCVVCGLLRINKEDAQWQVWCALTSLLAGLFSLIGCLVFGLGQPRPSIFTLSYAYVFNIVSGCFCLLASPVLYIDIRLMRR